MADAEILRSAQDDGARAAVASSSVTSKWRRYLADLQTATGEPLPLETQGRLVRVTGLVLEAAGIRVPVGSVCEIHQDGLAVDATPPVVAEVVGFSGDRAYLMPTGDVHGLASGALVVPRPSPIRPMKLGTARHPWRRTVDRTLHLPVGDGLLGRVVDSQGQPMDRKGPLALVHDEPRRAPADQRHGPRPGAHAARHRRARDQRHAHRRPRPAHRPVRRRRRRQERAARHDGALHRAPT